MCSCLPVQSRKLLLISAFSFSLFKVRASGLSHLLASCLVRHRCYRCKRANGQDLASVLTAQIHISCYTIFTTILVGRNNLNSYYCTMQVDSHAATCCWRTPRVCLNLPTHTPSWSAVVSHNRLQAKWSGSLRIIKQVLRQKAASYAIIPGNFKGDLQSPGQ